MKRKKENTWTMEKTHRHFPLRDVGKRSDVHVISTPENMKGENKANAYLKM